MSTGYPPQELDCPDPADCPVITVLPQLTLIEIPTGRRLYRVYDATCGYDEFNPGYGDARFSPFDHSSTGERVAAMYLAQDPTSALLETVFHDVHHTSGRTIYERDLVGKLLAHVRVPGVAMVGDLRDPELARLGLKRSSVVSTSAEHYPCTRRLAAQALHQDHGATKLQGLVWHSRQAELAGGRRAAEAVVLFGPPHTTQRGTWDLPAPGARTLYDGPGRILVDELVEQLRATVIAGP